MSTTAISLIIVCIFCCGSLSGLKASLLKLGKLHAKEEFKKHPSLFFFQHLLAPLFGSNKWEGLFLTLSFSKQILYMLYAIFATYFLSFFSGPQSSSLNASLDKPHLLSIIPIICLPLIFDILIKLLSNASPKRAFPIFSPVSSLFLTLFSPLTTFFMFLSKKILATHSTSVVTDSSLRDKILEILYESELSTHLDPQERKLILSVANFKERHVREIMVPRIDIVCISEETTLQQAVDIFLKERYSRLPVYQDTIDNVTGILLLKDVLTAFISHPRETPIRNLLKPVLYTPESKKIAQLLQEFRYQQIHLAIVVDEYGGTEGIITIEDILEQLVGEIADEDDTEQDILYSVLPSGGWVVDARMNILEIEKELSIQLPQSADYDTLGGYIYHRAGAIPAKGWRLHHDDFDLEILSSDQRSIGKVKVIPHFTSSI